MRGALLVLLIGFAGAPVAAASPPPPRPEVERRCSGPLDEPNLRACFTKVEPKVKLVQISPGVIAARMPDDTVYLLMGGARWRIGFHEYDEHYEALGTTRAKLSERDAVRVDLLHHIDLSADSVLLERIAVLCRDDGLSCESVTTACTVLVHGRTTQMFRLTLTDGPGGLTASGDRAYAGDTCGGR